MRRLIASLAAVGAVFAGAAPAAAGTASPTEASLVGSATLWRAAGDKIRFTFDAHGFGLDVRGTFRVSHYLGDQGAWMTGTIDCLVVGGDVAVVTGIITASSVPEWVGVRRGMTVYDHGRRDRVGYSWVLDPGSTESVPQCVSGAPYEWVETGDFRAVEWFPFPGPPVSSH
ncbi:hypothetical protein GCM10010435_77110 [Winogradskya consettensis]|uniref:Repetin n=1 Tax=Winogradskya consettensis TaxID=113560 RepID=A0A919VTA8_9ACTN|nr:hypothetical protein [Actinoplanes consettensis]GIM74635.1 hypothetical protein Aco04nite_41320 [Actinoplanes consettensis]